MLPSLVKGFEKRLHNSTDGRDDLRSALRPSVIDGANDTGWLLNVLPAVFLLGFLGKSHCGVGHMSSFRL